jgi:HAD superfamily phosphatase (TIGR01681 family)
MNKANIKAVVFDVRGVIVSHLNDRDIIPGIVKLLNKLKDNEIILAIVSSFSVHSVKEMVGDIKAFFDDNIYSGSRLGKLNKIIEFAKKVNIDLSEIAFIDDKPNNLEPVKKNSEVFTIGFKGSGKYKLEIQDCCKQIKIPYADNINELEEIILNKIKK